MKKIIILFIAFTSTVMSTNAQQTAKEQVVDTKKHQVVMQVTQGDSLFQLSVISQLKNIKKALPKAEIEVVCHSQGLPMLVKNQTKVAKHIEELSQQNVTFAACENTMQRHKIKKSDLLPQATTVPSGLVEIILKQEAGWSYVKGGI
ncbi:intracellular sulfur oxidation DsrE/DsrF family protein [Catalinimonas alkaloidigena]|uniref:DsrE family protein n=1 Tax=Catalinimonas alkaloidigena TaxID=1075417 RepID=UPI002405C9BB|nr:DsrE family protein [Catalinimonas alkaloidigena]MDF9797904.1 intracellular sulfur oxidation DsrE/DsrF family protein [Catalinimonas alkaloidigena]